MTLNEELYAIITDRSKYSDRESWDWYSKKGTECFNKKTDAETRSCLWELVSIAYDDAYGYIDSEIAGQIKSVSKEAISDAFDTIESYTSQAFDSALESAGSVIDSISGTVSETVVSVFTSVSEFLDKIWSNLNNLVLGVRQVIDDIINGFWDLIDSVMYNIQDFAYNLLDSFNYVIESAFRYLSDLYESVKETLMSLYESAVEFMLGLYESAKEAIEELSSQTIEYISSIYNDVSESVESMLSSASDIIDKSLEGLEDVAESVIGTIDTLMSYLKADVAPSLAILAKASTFLFGIVENEENATVASEVNDAFSRIFKALSAYSGPADNVESAFSQTGVYETVFGTILSSAIYAVSIAMMAGQAASITNAAKSQELLYNIMSNNPLIDFTMPEAASLRSRGFISEADHLKAGLKQGYDDEKSNIALEAAYKPIDPTYARSAEFRGMLDQTGYKDMLKRSGYKDKDIETLYNLGFVLPPVSDLISMAVREVFSEDIAERFEIFSDLPDEFVVEAAKQGLTKEWATRYWGAHWRLPSAQQGFEMYHRKVMGDEDLSLLLRALDVSPYWRDKLKAIAYQPITRVDIRRIYKLGLIDLEDVKKRLEDIGYSPDDAVLMAEFYRVYAGDLEDEEVIDTKSLTRAQIQKLWTIGTLTDEEAIKSMVEAGYSKDMSSLLVNSWKDEALIKERQDMINRLARRAIREGLNDTEINALFYDLDLTPEELNKVKKIIVVEQQEFDANPSRTDIRNFFKAGVIDAKTWRTYMKRLKYSDEVIDMYSEYDFGEIV